MAMTQTEAAKLSNDILKTGVIETVVKDSVLLQKLPFIDIVGNGLTYNKENVLPTIDFYDVGDTWNESTPTFTQRTAVLKVMGGDADVDEFLKATRSNLQDLQGTVIELKSKALRYTFETNFIYGNSNTNPKQFDGLVKQIDTATGSNQLIAAGATGAALTLAMLDQLIDAIKGGKPELLMMSRRSRRKINALIRADGSGMMETDRDQWGNFIQLWNGIPIGINDNILDTHTLAGSVETAYTGSTCSTIYTMSFGENALAGLQSPDGIQVQPLGALESKNADRTRIKWYCSLALFSALKAAALIGVQD